MVLFITAVLLMSAINAWLDYMVITRGGSPDHTKSAFIRGLAILALSVIINGYWMLILARFIFGAALFWIVFELVLNKLRNRDWLYVGENAKTDQIFKYIFLKNTGIFMLVFKLTILISSICLMVHFGQE